MEPNEQQATGHVISIDLPLASPKPVDLIMQIEIYNREVNLHRFRAYVGVTFAFVVFMVVSYFLFLAGEPPSTFMFFFFAGVFAVPYLIARSSKAMNESLRKIANTDDLNALGPLIDCSNSVMSRSAMKMVRKRISALLPMLKYSDRYLLTKGQRATLRSRLSLISHPTLPDGEEQYLALLIALSQIGDETDLAVVRRLAVIKMPLPAIRRISQAAAECAEMIEARLEANRDSDRLLRPAAEPLDNLLRPATSGIVEAHALLRPAERVTHD
ncbi:MAG: hypothetical protein ABJA67_11610 [Chthonomonadales bacterium]